MEFLIRRGQLPLTREGRAPLFLGRLLPVPQATVGHPQLTGDLGDRQTLVGDHPESLELELPGVNLAGHWCPPRGEFTPLTPTPPTLGNLRRPTACSACASSPVGVLSLP